METTLNKHAIIDVLLDYYRSKLETLYNNTVTEVHTGVSITDPLFVTYANGMVVMQDRKAITKAMMSITSKFTKALAVGLDSIEAAPYIALYRENK